MEELINATIVVEGKNDVRAVKNALNCEVISTNGLGINDSILNKIKAASERSEIIILTDPDSPGSKIRNIISDEIPDALHAYIPKNRTLKNGKVGVENASSEDIRKALKFIRKKCETSGDYSTADLLKYKLTGFPESSSLRDVLCLNLGIGHCSAKSLVKKLNYYNISREEFSFALHSVVSGGKDE